MYLQFVRVKPLARVMYIVYWMKKMGINKVRRFVRTMTVAAKSHCSQILQVSHTTYDGRRHHIVLFELFRGMWCEVLLTLTLPSSYTYMRLLNLYSCCVCISMDSTGAAIHPLHKHTHTQTLQSQPCMLRIHWSNKPTQSKTVCLHIDTHLHWSTRASIVLWWHEGSVYARQRYKHTSRSHTTNHSAIYNELPACIQYDTWFAHVNSQLFSSASIEPFAFASQTADPPSWTHAIHTTLLKKKIPIKTGLTIINEQKNSQQPLLPLNRSIILCTSMCFF